MAQVPYDHIEAPRVLRIDGVIAFQPNDPVPVDTARRLGLLDSEDAPEIIPAFGIASSPQFSDAEIKVAAEAAAAGVTNPTSVEDVTNQGAPASDATPPPVGDATTATSPQTPAEARRRATGSTPTP